MEKRIGYVNLTPRYEELVNVWKMLVNDSVGRVKKPETMKNFWDHFTQASRVADRYNDLVASLRDYGWTDEAFEKALVRGRELQEKARNEIHYEDAA